MPAKILFNSILVLFLVLGSVSSPVSAKPVITTPGTAPQKNELKGSSGEIIESVISRLTLEEKIGQLFIVAADENAVTMIRSFHIGGVVLFSRHAQTLQETMRLIEKIRQSSTLPPFVAVDQEGGRISRLPFATQVPSARGLGTLSEGTVQKIGNLVGSELQALGFNLNFAPVLDVDTCPENPVIGDRSFGQDPATVAKLGGAFIRGFHDSGILSAAKHFPGHGDTRSDSHLTIPVVSHSIERLHAVELLPFYDARNTGVDMIMVGHVHYPALDPTPNLPATLSKPIITGLLRKRMNFNGIIITDAMDMKAITNFYDPGQASRNAFLAGADIILMPKDLHSSYYALLSSVKSGEIPISRLDESVRRILAVKLLRIPESPAKSFDLKLKIAQNTVGSPAHRLVLDQLLQEHLPAPALQKSQ